jgi:IPT/TIG domain-containing protein
VFFTRDAKVVSNVPAGVLDPALGYAPPAPQNPLPPVTVSSLSPSTAPRGSAITINGAGFDLTAANNTVVFTTATAAVAVPAAVSTPTYLTVTIPSNAVTGPVFFTTGGRFSNSVTLTVP